MPKTVPRGGLPINDFYHSSMWIFKGVIFIKYKQNLIITLPVAKEMVQNRKDFAGSKPRWLFTNASGLLYIDAPARAYLASEEACEFLKGGTLYTSNRLVQVVAQAFLLLDRPLIPMNVFGDELLAMQWLEHFAGMM